MAARSRRRRHSRGRGHGGGLKTAGIVILAVLLSAGMGAGAWWHSRQQRAAAIDQTRLCPTATGPVGMTAILLDLTDALSPAQKSQLLGYLEQEIDDAPQGTQFTLGVVSADPDQWGATPPLCKPQDVSTASALTQNPGLIAKRYRDRFLQPLQDNIARMTAASGAKQSPIMESLQALIADTPGFVTYDGPRRVLLVSDLLQHSDALSFYRGNDWQSFVKSPAYQRLGATLGDAEIRIFQVPRPLEGVDDPAVLEDFWARYFDVQGAHLPVLKRLGDL